MPKDDTRSLINAGPIDSLNRLDVATSKFQKGKRRGSIIYSARDNIFEFPVFVSNSVSLEYATAINSLLEQQYASFLQMAISQNPYVEAEKVRQGLQFADYKTDTAKYLEYMELDFAREACHNVIQEGNYRFEFDLMSVEDSVARVINEAMEYEPLSEFDHFFQEAIHNTPRGTPDIDYYSPRTVTRNHDETDPQGNTIHVTNSRTYQSPDQIDAASRAEDTANADLYGIPAQVPQGGIPMDSNERNRIGYLQNIQNQRAVNARNAQIANSPYYNATNALQSGLKPLETLGNAADKGVSVAYNIASFKDRRAIDRGRVTQTELQNQELQKKNQELEKKLGYMDTEKQLDIAKSRQAIASAKVAGPITYMDETKAQKLNTMKPLIFNVQLIVMNKDDTVNPINYQVGVKCRCHMIDSTVLPDVAKYPLKEMDKVARKVKWKAGELKFMKDLVFHIDEKKQTAVDSKDPRRKWYRRLYELAHIQGDAPASSVLQGNSLFKTFIRDKLSDKRQTSRKLSNGFIPNVSLVISQNDVDNVKNQTKIDLLDGSTAKKFCGELFLMNLVVIDIDAEAIKIIQPENHSNFEVMSFASLNKQIATLDTAGTKTRDMFKLLG